MVEEMTPRTIRVVLGKKQYSIKTSLDEKASDRVVSLLQEAFSKTPYNVDYEERLLLVALQLVYDLISLEKRLEEALKSTEGKRDI